MNGFFPGPGRLVLRWAGAIALVTLGVWIAKIIGPIGIIFCLPFVVLAALFVLPELVLPFTWIIDRFYGTAPGSGERPPLDLRLARFYVAQERFAEALEEYARIMEWHPAISEPYEQTMRLLAQTKAGGKREVERVYRKGRRRLRSADARADLDRARGEALTLLGPGAK